MALGSVAATGGLVTVFKTLSRSVADFIAVKLPPIAFAAQVNPSVACGDMPSPKTVSLALG